MEKEKTCLMLKLWCGSGCSSIVENHISHDAVKLIDEIEAIYKIGSVGPSRQLYRWRRDLKHYYHLTVPFTLKVKLK